MKPGRALTGAIVNAVLADVAAEVQLARLDFRKSLLLQPAMVENLREFIELKVTESLASLANTERTVMNAATRALDAQGEINRDHAEHVHASCIKAAQATVAEAIRLSAERELHRTSVLKGFGWGAGATLVAVLVGALAVLLVR